MSKRPVILDVLEVHANFAIASLVYSGYIVLIGAAIGTLSTGIGCLFAHDKCAWALQSVWIGAAKFFALLFPAVFAAVSLGVFFFFLWQKIFRKRNLSQQYRQLLQRQQTGIRRGRSKRQR